jgi:hypothetical protein
MRTTVPARGKRRAAVHAAAACARRPFAAILAWLALGGIVRADDTPPADDTSPGGMGRIEGRVVDAESDEPLFDAAVEVLETGDEVRTDEDGRYALELPPGSYTLRCYYPFYLTERYPDVRVRRGGRVRLELRLDLDAAADSSVEVREVVARAEIQTEAAQLLERQNAATVSDNISAQEMSRGSSGTASEAARRVTGASVVDDRYVYVRGLGERYGNTLFNGTLLPSPEPDRRVVPLDIFPTNLLGSFQIVKTATPDIPADFAGGSSQITTRTYPGEFTLRLGASVGANSQVTFQDTAMADVGNLDFLGYDDGSRDILAGLPSEQILIGTTRPDGTVMTPESVEGWGEGLHNVFYPTTRTAWPNLSLNFSVGDTVDVDPVRIGYSLGLTYSNGIRGGEQLERSYSLGEVDTDGDTIMDSSELIVRSNYSGERAVNSVLWGLLGNFALELEHDQTLALNLLFTRKADNAFLRLMGKDPDESLPTRYDRLQYTGRDLFFGQVIGDHALPAVGDSELHWQLNLSTTNRDEPDTREVLYQAVDAAGSGWEFADGSQSGSHFASEMSEISGGGGIDWTFHLNRNDLTPRLIKLGGMTQYRDRTFAARRFRFLRQRRGDPAAFLLPADELFTQEHIGPDLRLQEATRVDDTYNATQLLGAGYGMLDLTLLPGFRVIGGVRAEYSDQEVVTRNPYAAPGSEPVAAGLTTTDFFPSVNVVLGVADDMNLRFAVAETIARPEFRELTPFAYFDFVGGQMVYGNPDLQSSRILNLDLRWEWFHQAGEVIALSAFYKDLARPIEAVLMPTTELARSYQNAAAARVAGAELEVRSSFGFIHEALAGLSFVGNFTYVWSRVELDTSQLGVQTRNDRPLQGQSPYVINLGLEYANEDWGTRLRLMYNVMGERIDQVGAMGLPDIYEQPRHLLDFVAEQDLDLGMSLKLTVQNMLDQRVRYTQEGNVVSEYRPGVNVNVAFSWAY